MTDTRKCDPTKEPEGEACVGCEHVRGIILHHCGNPESEFYRGFVHWEGWCPHFEARDLEASA